MPKNLTSEKDESSIKILLIQHLFQCKGQLIWFWHVIGNRWGRWQISYCYSWTATLCLSFGWLDPSFWTTIKVVIISPWSLFQSLEKYGCCLLLMIIQFVPGMLDIHPAFVKKLVHMVEILWEYLEFISLRRWSSFALLVQITMNPGQCMRKWSKTLRISTKWYHIHKYWNILNFWFAHERLG